MNERALHSVKRAMTARSIDTFSKYVELEEIDLEVTGLRYSTTKYTPLVEAARLKFAYSVRRGSKPT